LKLLSLEKINKFIFAHLIAIFCKDKQNLPTSKIELHFILIKRSQNAKKYEFLLIFDVFLERTKCHEKKLKNKSRSRRRNFKAERMVYTLSQSPCVLGKPIMGSINKRSMQLRFFIQIKLCGFSFLFSIFVISNENYYICFFLN